MTECLGSQKGGIVLQFCDFLAGRVQKFNMLCQRAHSTAPPDLHLTAFAPHALLHVAA
jgi:hypothetical protein